MEGAKLIRNITLAGAFWAAFAMLIMNANAGTNIYDSEGSVKTVTTSPGMNPGTVPQANVSVDSAKASASDAGNANSGGTQVQNVTVQANPTSGAQAEAAADSNSNAYQSVDQISKIRSSTEQTHNALLLQQLELDRLKAEQHRLDAIQKFSTTPEVAPAVPCGLGPCIPAGAAQQQQQQQPQQPQALIENNNVSSSEAKVAAVEVPHEHGGEVMAEAEEPSHGSWLSDTKLGISPIVGKRWFSKSSAASVTNLYLVGAALDGEINKWVSADMSFVYGKDSIGNAGCFGCRKFDRDSLEFAGGVKVGQWMGRFFRPYIAGGLGYIHQTYDTHILYKNSSNNFETNLGLGTDVKLSRNFSLGARADYQFLFGSNDKLLSKYFGDDSNRFRVAANAIWRF